MPAEVATRDQISENISHVRTLLRSGDEDSAASLTAETTLLIDALTGRGSSVAKRKFTEELSEAHSAVRAGAATRESVTLDSVRGLLDEGARLIADGVMAYMSTADLARKICRHQIGMHVRLTDRDGDPDLRGLSKGAKQVNTALIERAGTLVEGDQEEVRQALEKLVKSVHNHKGAVRQAYVLSLDSKDHPDRDLFEPIAKGKKGKFSEAVARHYGISLELPSGPNRASGVSSASPLDVRASALVARMRRDLQLATPAELQALPPATKAEIRRELKDISRDLRTIAAAVKQ